MWSKVEDNQIVKTITAPRPVEADGVRYPASIFRDLSWTNEQLAELGWYPVQRQTERSRPYHDAMTPQISLVDGRPVETIAFVPVPLDRIKAEKNSAVKIEYARRLNEGFVFDDSVPIDITPESQSNIDTEYSAALDETNIPEWQNPYIWKGFDNSFYPLSRSEVISMALAARLHKRALYTAKWTHEGTIGAMTEDHRDALIGYDVSTGWPQSAAEWQAEELENV